MKIIYVTIGNFAGLIFIQCLHLQLFIAYKVVFAQPSAVFLFYDTEISRFRSCTGLPEKIIKTFFCLCNCFQCKADQYKEDEWSHDCRFKTNLMISFPASKSSPILPPVINKAWLWGYLNDVNLFLHLKTDDYEKVFINEHSSAVIIINEQSASWFKSG